MSDLGTVHVLIPDGHRIYDNAVPYSEGQALGLRQSPDGPMDTIFGVLDWWWEVDPARLPDWACGQVEACGDKVHRRQ